MSLEDDYKRAFLACNQSWCRLQAENERLRKELADALQRLLAMGERDGDEDAE
jgi:hypothetical protein